MVDVGARVYAPLGDYRAILPDWVRHPGVFGFVCEDDGADPLGYILVGFYRPADLVEPELSGLVDAATRDLDDDLTAPGVHVGDLLAIAVEPAAQSRGVGSRLLAYAIDLATVAGERMTVPELRLTVADSNAGAQRLFARNGFVVMNERHGAYDGGQVAVRMRRRLP